MRWVFNILALLLFLMGTVWILQGTGVYPVGFMARQTKWTLIGTVVDLAAVGLFILANRRGKKLPPSS